MKNFMLTVVVITFFVNPVFSQNFDYQLQNSLERIYLNHESENKDEFKVFRKTFFAEGYSSFDYLYSILNNNKKLESKYPLFFHRVDSTQLEVFKEITNKMIKKGKLIDAWVFGIDSFLNYLSNIEHFFAFVIGCFSNNYMVLFYFLVIVGLLFFVRFIRLLFYDVKRICDSKNLNYTLAYYLVLLVIVFMPVFLTIHIKFLPVYWLLLFFIYTSKREKVIVYLSLFLLFLVTAVGIYFTSLTKHFYKKNAYYYESITSPFSGISKNTKTGDEIGNFAKGISLLRSGNAIESIKLFKTINSRSGLYKYSLNNIGVAYIILSRPKLALNFFDEAIKNGLNFEPNINKFYLNNKLYNIVEAEEALKKAYSASYLDTVKWLKLNIKETLPVMAVPSFKDILISLKKGFSFSIMENLFNFALFIVVLLIILIVIHYISTEISVTRGCKKCGTPFKVFESQNEKFCTQCTLLSKAKSDISSEMKEQKRNEIRFYSFIKRSMEIAIGCVFPGFYNIFVLQRVFSGFVMFFVFFILLIDSLRLFKVTQNIVLVSPLIVMLLLVYFINLINIFFEREEI